MGGAKTITTKGAQSGVPQMYTLNPKNPRGV